MERYKKTLCQIFGKSPISDEKDVAQNIYTFRFVLFCMVIYSVENVMNMFGIFIVDKKIFMTGYVAACFFAVVHIILLLALGLEHHLTKYVSIAAIMCVIVSASISLTYHMVIIIMIPLVIAGMYTSKRISVYTFILTIISIVLSTYGGYYFGICDANMALLTATSIGNLDKNGIFQMSQINPNPVLTIGLYFVIPRCLLAVAFAYVSNSVNTIIRKSQKKAVKMEIKASKDDMTGLYNKNKLLSLVEDKSYDYQDIAVVYWDVNKLKYVNDNYGHLSGDRLIMKVAESILKVAKEDCVAFRYGGDEFLMIIRQGTEKRAEELIEIWKKELENLSVDCDFPVSASVGYAIGKKECLKDVIAIADHNMYLCKQKTHNERV